MPPHLNHMGDDVPHTNKGFIAMALRRVGAYYSSRRGGSWARRASSGHSLCPFLFFCLERLKVNLANLFGKNKISFQERAEWVESQREMILKAFLNHHEKWDD